MRKTEKYNTLKDLAEAILDAAGKNDNSLLDKLKDQFIEMGSIENQNLLAKCYTVQEILSGSYKKKD